MTCSGGKETEAMIEKDLCFVCAETELIVRHLYRERETQAVVLAYTNTGGTK